MTEVSFSFVLWKNHSRAVMAITWFQGPRLRHPWHMVSTSQFKMAVWDPPNRKGEGKTEETKEPRTYSSCLFGKFSSNCLPCVLLGHNWVQLTIFSRKGAWKTMVFTAGGHGQVKTESSLIREKRTDPEVGPQQSQPEQCQCWYSGLRGCQSLEVRRPTSHLTRPQVSNWS